VPDEKTQADKFRDAARGLDCDLDEETFDRALGRIAKAPADKDADATRKRPNKREPTDGS